MWKVSVAFELGVIDRLVFISQIFVILVKHGRVNKYKPSGKKEQLEIEILTFNRCVATNWQ